MKKKLTALGLVVAVVASLFAGMTLTYFTDKDTVTNTFTIGDVDIDVYETSASDPSIKVDSNTYTNIVPGVKYAKDPTIENIGSNGAYARMLVTVPKDLHNKLAELHFTLSDIFEKALDENDEWKWTYDEFIENAGENAVTYIYNYNGTLGSGEKATLFKSFTLPATLSQDDLTNVNHSFNIVVTGQAIQADGFTTAAAAFAALDDEINNNN